MYNYLLNLFMSLHVPLAMCCVVYTFLYFLCFLCRKNNNNKIIIIALGTIPKALEKHLKEIGISVRVQLPEGGTRDSKDSAKYNLRSKATDVA